MKENEPITITRVANGYTVTGFYPSQCRSVSVPDPDTFVFESRENLSDWMYEHFPHPMKATP